MNVVKAMFPSGHAYSYFVPMGDNPKVGDVILTSISLPEFNKSMLLSDHDVTHVMSNGKLARVTQILSDCPKATKMYLQLISADEIRNRYETNVKYMEVAKKKKAIRQKLDELLKSEDALDRYRRLAQSNTEAAELLRELET